MEQQAASVQHLAADKVLCMIRLITVMAPMHSMMEQQATSVQHLSASAGGW